MKLEVGKVYLNINTEKKFQVINIKDQILTWKFLDEDGIHITPYYDDYHEVVLAKQTVFKEELNKILNEDG